MAVRGYQIIEIANFLESKNIEITCDVLTKCVNYLEHDYNKKLENISVNSIKNQLTKFIETDYFKMRHA